MLAGTALALLRDSACASNSLTSKQESLLDAIRTFGKDNFGLQLKPNFYTEWDDQKGLLYYLYVSEAKELKAPEGFGNFRFFGHNKDEALRVQDEYGQQGLHTWLYGTVGNSSAKLNAELLSYRPETIAFILFHEMVHVNRQQKGFKFPYPLEEALGDLLGNIGSELFTAKTERGSSKVAKQQRKWNERLYSSMAEVYEREATDGYTPDLLQVVSKLLKRQSRKADAFQKQRFMAEVNNAYLVRCRSYSEHYFLLKQLYEKLGNFKKVFAFCETVGGDLESALIKIQKASK
jgi:hypothetical protein